LDFEVERNNNSKTQYLSLTQYPIDLTENDSAKLLYVHDLTFTKKLAREEKENLISKSLIDSLTGIYNRGYLNDLVLATPKLNKAYTVLFMDIDKFKSINDEYGHDIGDEVLKALANIITNSIRSKEKAVRYGGDEFLVIFEKLSLDDALAVSERIRINTNNLQHSKEFQNMPITLSIGISIGVKNLENLIKQADIAMYDSKKRKGNLTTIYKDIMIKNNTLGI
jgi:diguanylate cyclase (GGDEF)-like protein